MDGAPVIYVRTLFGQFVMPRRYGPKKDDSPSVGKCCPACHNYFLEGCFTTLIPLGPGEDPEERRKCELGLFYSAVAIEVHWECATGHRIEEA